MASLAPVGIESEANIFQKYLIPSESRMVRYCMQKAGIFSSCSNFFYAHFVSVGFAVAAVAMSFFNTFSYFLQSPFKIILKIVQFNPIGAVTGFIGDLTNGVRSLVFVSMGVTFIVVGLLFPKAIFTHFAPEYYDSLEARLLQENAMLRKKNNRLEEENKTNIAVIDKESTVIQDLERENDDLKHPIRNACCRKLVFFFSILIKKLKCCKF
ncbi:MAG: hypothetical protein K1000chlam3_01512 [Chlamydiae bacterium]|nr:hypothetical protein [Chlamydiota bacterium]